MSPDSKPILSFNDFYTPFIVKFSDILPLSCKLFYEHILSMYDNKV